MDLPAILDMKFAIIAINGWRFVADADATAGFILGHYEQQAFRFEALVEWLRVNVEAVPT